MPGRLWDSKMNQTQCLASGPHDVSEERNAFTVSHRRVQWLGSLSTCYGSDTGIIKKPSHLFVSLYRNQALFLMLNLYDLTSSPQQPCE